jgi:glycosyltransferase involved in cell wall biosynthesis
MKIAALLPHVEVFGGVRRYIELGNEFVRPGHTYVLFHPHGEKPEWLDFYGLTRPFSSLEDEEFDVGLCSEYSIVPHFEKLRARKKYFYFLLEGHKKEREVIRKNFLFLGNSEGMCRHLEKKYGIKCFRAPGGVNTRIFYPLENGPSRDTINILSYGRIYKRRKGIKHVIRAVESLYREYPQLRLVFFDTLVGGDQWDPRQLIKTRVPHDFYLNLPQDKMAWLFSQADMFVSAERRAGWANTSAEAMACRLPVICTQSGSRDFALHNQTALVVPFPLPFFLRRHILRLIKNPALRDGLAEAGYRKIQEFTWASLAERLLALFEKSAEFPRCRKIETSGSL